MRCSCERCEKKVHERQTLEIELHHAILSEVEAHRLMEKDYPYEVSLMVRALRSSAMFG